MSVIIKDMKMPKHCIDCPMKNDEDDCVVQELQHWRDWDDMKAGCPLVEVPTPHGILIDANELMNRIKQIEYNSIVMRDIYPGFRCDAIEWWCVEDLVNKSPTFIEAEVEE